MYTRCTFEGIYMRIQEVVQKTGLQKRTIYYYIDEKLIEPATDTHSGYHNFSEEDVQKLTIIRKLRDAGFPLADIRTIFHHPRTTDFYLHKRLNQLQADILVMEETMKKLDQFAGQLPVCGTLEELASVLSEVEFKPDSSKFQASYESRDAWLIARYLWKAYTGAPMTEYRQFLWQKIMQHTIEHTHTDLRIMAQYLQYLPPEKVDTAGVRQYLHNQKIIALDKTSCPDYVEQMKQDLLRFCSNPIQKEQWKLLYEPIIRPTTVFAFSASRWLLEFHPDYQCFYQNIHTCCMMLKTYMNSAEGRKFKNLLEDAFDSPCDFEASSYGELEIAASFSDSVYALLKPDEIRKFLVRISE